MTPAEAGGVQFEAPDWHARLIELIGQSDMPTPELREDEAFEKLLREYRRFNFTWVDPENPDSKKMPMEATRAMIELAGMRLFAPRSRAKDLPRGGPLYVEQHDDHVWLTVAGRARRIVGIEDKIIFLEAFGESSQVDVSKVRWSSYIEKAVEMLRAAWPSTHQS